jgi:ElaB/YqjD/DUF883 family membrane-anchored ribosome-binding protein
MADTRSPDEIEREIEHERAQLSSTLDTLTEKFSVDRVVRTGQDYLSEHGGELATNFARTIKETPTAAVLTAIGIGWLILGNQRQRVVEYRDRSYPGASYDRTPRASYDTSYRSASTGSTAGTGTSNPYGSTGGMPSSAGTGSDDDFEARVAAADARMRSQATGTTGIVTDESRAYRTYDAQRDTVSREYGDGRSGDETSMLDRISDQAQDLWQQTVASIRSGYDSATSSARSGYQSAHRSATELRNSFFEGTEKMDIAGRERVASARARAYEAQLRTQSAARRGQQQASDMFNDQPLVAGAIAMALGAVVGGLLPRTRREDEAFGAYRDQLFSDAESVFQDERMRAEAAARAALDEARSIGEEAKDSVLGHTPDGRETVREAENQARTAAQRVADAARAAHDDPEKARSA